MKSLHGLSAGHAKRVVNYVRLVIILAASALAFAPMALAADWFVAINGTGQGTSWADATNSLQGAINATSDGETVWVSNGVYDAELTVTPGYALTNRVVITNAITVRSANNDPTNTIIKGAGPLGDNAVRCVFMSNSASLIGFTLTNGYTLTNGSAIHELSGGGVLLFANGVVSNCLISGNMASNGAGACLPQGGIVNNCTLDGNSVFDFSGGRGGGASLSSSSATLSNCLITGNSARWGGGVDFSAGTVVNCTLAENTTAGGGNAGGGANMSGTATLKNCTLSKNMAEVSGGGGVFITGGNLYNCLILENSGNYAGVRINGGPPGFYNCTITMNTGTSVGGLYAGAGKTGYLENCIIWGNTGPSSNISMTTLTLNCCCSGPVQSGSGNIGADPQFVDTNTANYRLKNNSPCINGGTNGSWTTDSVDLDGRARIRYGIADMGAYERIHAGTFCGVH